MADDALKIKAADRMRRLCSRREYCSSDIMKKLVDALEGDHNAAMQVLESLVTGGYETDTSMLDEEFGINLMNAALAAARSLR